MQMYGEKIIFKPKTGSKSLYEISNENGVSIVRFAYKKLTVKNGFLYSGFSTILCNYFLPLCNIM
jgi:hypothetical protein